MSQPKPRTLGELKSSGYQPQSIRAELRRNLIAALRSKADVKVFLNP